MVWGAPRLDACGSDQQHRGSRAEDHKLTPMRVAVPGGKPGAGRHGQPGPFERELRQVRDKPRLPTVERRLNPARAVWVAPFIGGMFAAMVAGLARL